MDSSDDGPFLHVRDSDALREYSHALTHYWLRRKVGIAPRPSNRLERCVSPTQEQFDKAWSILDAYKEATEGEARVQSCSATK